MNIHLYYAIQFTVHHISAVLMQSTAAETDEMIYPIFVHKTVLIIISFCLIAVHRTERSTEVSEVAKKASHMWTKWPSCISLA